MLGRESELAADGLIAHKRHLQQIGAIRQATYRELTSGIGDGSLHHLAGRGLHSHIDKLHGLVGLLVNHSAVDTALGKGCQGAHQ